MTLLQPVTVVQVDWDRWGRFVDARYRSRLESRTAEDALIDAGVVVDDARFACITVTKTLAYPGKPWTGAQITITPLAHEVQP